LFYGRTCFDTDNGAYDNYGQSCEDYNDDPQLCSDNYDYDDDDFVAAEMCCGCGGGVDALCNNIKNSTNIMTCSKKRVKKEGRIRRALGVVGDDTCAPQDDKNYEMQSKVVEWLDNGDIDLNEFSQALYFFFNANPANLTYDANSNTYQQITDYINTLFPSSARGWCTIITHLLSLSGGDECSFNGNTVSIPARCPESCPWNDSCPEECPLTLSETCIIADWTDNNKAYYDCHKSYCDFGEFTEGLDYKKLNHHSLEGDCETCAELCNDDADCTSFECDPENCYAWYNNKCNDPNITTNIVTMTCVAQDEKNCVNEFVANDGCLNYVNNETSYFQNEICSALDLEELVDEATQACENDCVNKFVANGGCFMHVHSSESFLYPHNQNNEKAYFPPHCLNETLMDRSFRSIRKKKEACFGTCSDTDNGAYDNQEQSCEWYNDNPRFCFDDFDNDDDDFVAAEMCCGCGGGSHGPNLERPERAVDINVVVSLVFGIEETHQLNDIRMFARDAFVENIDVDKEKVKIETISETETSIELNFIVPVGDFIHAAWIEEHVSQESFPQVIQWEVYKLSQEKKLAVTVAMEKVFVIDNLETPCMICDNKMKSLTSCLAESKCDTYEDGWNREFCKFSLCGKEWVSFESCRAENSVCMVPPHFQECRPCVKELADRIVCLEINGEEDEETCKATLLPLRMCNRKNKCEGDYEHSIEAEEFAVDILHKLFNEIPLDILPMEFDIVNEIDMGLNLLQEFAKMFDSVDIDVDCQSSTVDIPFNWDIHEDGQLGEQDIREFIIDIFDHEASIEEEPVCDPEDQPERMRYEIGQWLKHGLWNAADLNINDPYLNPEKILEAVENPESSSDDSSSSSSSSDDSSSSSFYDENWCDIVFSLDLCDDPNVLVHCPNACGGCPTCAPSSCLKAEWNTTNEFECYNKACIHDDYAGNFSLIENHSGDCKSCAVQCDEIEDCDAFECMSKLNGNQCIKWTNGMCTDKKLMKDESSLSITCSKKENSSNSSSEETTQPETTEPGIPGILPDLERN